MIPASGSKTDGLLVSRLSGRVTEKEDDENFKEEVRVDRFETTEEDESFLLT